MTVRIRRSAYYWLATTAKLQKKGKAIRLRKNSTVKFGHDLIFYSVSKNGLTHLKQFVGKKGKTELEFGKELRFWRHFSFGFLSIQGHLECWNFEKAYTYQSVYY